MVENNYILKLDGAYNIRDLGGYKTLNGRKTKCGVFIRADGTGNLSEKDISILKNMGLSMVIDLRSEDEIKSYPSKLYGYNEIKYVNIVMFDGVQSAIIQGSIPSSMGKMYVSLLDRCHDKYVEIFRLFAENEGLTLFNCTAGKDRTGVVAMLLLQLVGVSDEVIIDDYAVSEHNLKVATENQKKMLKKRGIKIPSYIFKANPKNMIYTLNHLKDTYGNSEKYLLSGGLKKSEINIIKAKFLT